MSEEGFLARWSRRKRAAEAGLPVAEAPTAPAAPEAAPPAPAVSGAPPPPVAAEPPEPEIDLASLPPIETLTAASDFSVFLQRGVPEALRRAALRKAWSLDPVISTYIGPADYAWDFNAPDGVPGFALELGGDVRKLLAQAIGLDDDKEEGRDAPDPAAAPEGGDSDQPPEQPAMLAASTPAEDGLAEDPLADGAPAEAPDQVAAIAPPGEAQDAVPGTRPRRHGSALPA